MNVPAVITVDMMTYRKLDRFGRVIARPKKAVKSDAPTSYRPNIKLIFGRNSILPVGALAGLHLCY